ncbi:hypothetical protein [Nonomuraea sp. NPDC002799]
MQKSQLLSWPVSGLTLMCAGALIANTAIPADAHTVAPHPARGHQHGVPAKAAKGTGGHDDKSAPAPGWGVIGRNTLGGPNAVLRDGPYGRTSVTFPATQPPPYGDGSLGLIVGSGADSISFGNERTFAGVRLSSINTLRYWIFAGHTSLDGITLPNITIEADPNLGGATFTSLVYLPDRSASPSAPEMPFPGVWQRYDAHTAGSSWFATGATGPEIDCTQAVPCSFATLKSRLPNAVISFSLGIGKGRDTRFVGAVDGLQVNQTIYDFEFTGVRSRRAR